eukprot:2634625-Rhodomonas_salina.1
MQGKGRRGEERRGCHVAVGCVLTVSAAGKQPQRAGRRRATGASVPRAPQYQQARPAVGTAQYH